ncbi:MAG: thiol reductant ABC exporter subunit CydC [Hyphomicrobiales bacterium]|nr:thiol reductant ABC exporter subunit CydC [Hyphomicrobiales bacterium]MCP5371825.1 thiol reductant ABC exporter subunit CydC [Hyphomicrobiales bacterium]
MYFDRRLWAFTAGIRHRIAAAVAVGLVATGFAIARLALLGWLLGQVIAGRPLAELAWPAVAVAAVMAGRGGLEFLRTVIAHETGFAVQRRLSLRIYEQVVALGPAHFGGTRSGAVITAMVDGVRQLETYFGQYLPQLFVAALTPVVIFAFAAFLDPAVAGVMLAAALATLVAPMVFHRLDRDNALGRSKAYKAFAADFLDSIQGLGTLKAFGQSGPRIDLLADRAHALFRATMWVLATNALARGITDLGITLGAAAALALGAYRVTTGSMELGTLLILLMLGTEVFRPLRDLRALLHDGMIGQSAAMGIFEILDAEPLVNAKAQPWDGPAPASSRIEFDRVAFRYPGGEARAHDGLTFTVAEGERVGIVGASGAGKSTIMKLLLRLYDVTDGAIRVGGVDIRRLDPEVLRDRMAVVGQDTYLFHGTVEDNLRLGRPDATWDEIAAAARAANATEFIDRLPQGYRTVVGERGIRLSGGQRQRIAIARALLRDAEILVLDEALSAVDAENEAVIQEALDRLMAGRTTIIFAHRLSSVIDADRILVLDRGRLVEEGRHGDLMAAGGAYHALMADQAREAAGAGAAARLLPLAAPGAETGPAAGDVDDGEPADAILRAEGLTWTQAFAALLAEVRPWWGRFLMTLGFGIGRVVAYIGVGAMGALAVAAVKTGTPHAPYLWWLAVLAPLAGMLHWSESWVAHDMAFRMLAEMRIALFRKLDALAPAYLVRRRSGDLVAAATQDVEVVEYFFAHTVAPAFVAVLVPSAVLAILAAHGWAIALALLPFLAFVALSPFLMRGRVDRLGSLAGEALGELNAHAVDTVQGLGEVVAFGHGTSRGRAFDRLLERYHDARRGFFRDLAAQTAALDTMIGLGGLAVVVAGVTLVQSGRLDSAFLPLLTLLAMAAFLPVSEIAHVGRQLADTLGATRRLHAVHAEPVPVQDGPGVGAAETGKGVVLDGVCFAYRGRRDRALDDVDLDIPDGRTLALVGPSGAGKTTLAHLLMRFWDPDAGTVTLGGAPLTDYRLDELRGRIALVAQDTYLFNDTLRANIALARPGATEAEIRAAVERAALGDFVASLPQGLDTPVGERGMRLSGGQRQRIAIARAFLKDAPVLILDEATSHLDAISERAVHRSLRDLMHDRTTIVIAHRLSTVREADVIAVMDRGRVVETGRHEALLARGGLYAHLVGRQLAGAAAE